MTQKYQFEFISSYQGECDYLATRYTEHGRTENRISHRTGLSDYLKKYFNGTAEEYERDVIGFLHYVTGTGRDVITPELVAEFKSYLQDEWGRI